MTSHQMIMKCKSDVGHLLSELSEHFKGSQDV